MRDQELAYLRRVAQLTAAAEAVERQSYDSRMLEQLRLEEDQLGQLARVFDRMMTGIRSREAQLESRLRQLRREMEETAAGLPAPPPISEDSHFAVGDGLAGRYEIKRELGRGGMGMVYLAHDRELDEDVALKLVRRDLIKEDPTLLERLKSELRLARRISHRNVVRSHDLGEWQGLYFLSMEYVQGTTVADLIASHGRLSVDSTLAIATQLVDALVVAHAAQIIHRDIKPGNLLIDETGALKVTDFGLARPVQRNTELTVAGLAVGTPRYMSPEQLMADDVDARTDLFATGVVLYECLTGRVPFDASTPGGLVAQMLEGLPVPVLYLQPAVPRPLAAIIERLLQRDRDKRFPSARELADELTKVS
jgi:serine/threonine protein kinase